MANHVTTWIAVHQGTAQVFKKLKEMFTLPEGKWDYSEEIDFHKLLYPNHVDEDYDRNVFTERMGAKWCYISDVDVMDDDEFNMTTISAWNWSSGAFERLFEILKEIDEDVVLTATYEDEGYNFVGGAAISKLEGLFDYQDDTLEYPDKSTFKDENEYELAMNNFYELVGDAMVSCCDEALEDATWVSDEEE